VVTDGQADSWALPAWAERIVLILVLSVGVLGLVATALALLQVFRPWLALVLAVPLVVACLVFLGPVRPADSAPRSVHAAAAVGLLLVLAGTVFNVVHATEHLLIGRDPGIHVVAARALATEGDLFIPHDDYGAAADPEFRFMAGGQYEWGTDAIVPQGLHLLPSILAVAWGVGGTPWLIALPAVLGGIALLAFFALAARFVRPWWGVVATAVLAVSLPQVHFGRDAFTEIPSQVFVFASLWAMSWAVSRASPDDRRAWWVLAGFFAALTVATRLDGLLFFAPLLVAVALLDAGVVLQRAMPGAVHSFAIGATLPLVVATANLVGPGRPYVAGRAAQFILLVGLLAECVVLARMVLRRTDPERREAWRHRFGVIVRRGSIVVPVVLAVAWLAVPFLVDAGILPARARLGRPTYGEYGLARIAMFYGPVTLAAALVGLGIMLRRQQDRPSAVEVGLLVSAIPTVGLYVLWAPYIFPDLPWAMRRFLPVAIPAVVLLAVVAVDHVAERAAARHWAAGAGLAAVLVGALLVVPLRTVAPIADVTRFQGIVAGVEALCEQVPDDTVVAFAADRGENDVTLSAAVQAFCQVPVMMYSRHVHRREPVMTADYQPIADAVAASGRTLMLLSRDPPADVGEDDVTLLLDIGAPNLRWEYTEPPDTWTRWPIRLHATMVPGRDT